jgi:OOP family OmpA-OmpF porin
MIAAVAASFYLGVAGGYATTDAALVANRESTITNATAIRTDFDDRDGAWKVFAGYRFTPYFGVEAHYADLGRSRMSTTLQGGDPPAPASIAINRRIRGIGADLMWAVPIGERFSAFGRAGVFHAAIDADATLGGNIVFNPGNPDERSRSASANEVVGSYALGVDWRFAPRWGLRVEWQRYLDVGKAFAPGATGTTGEADIDFVAVGVTWRF